MIKSGMEKEVQYWYEEHKQSTGESDGEPSVRGSGSEEDRLDGTSWLY